MSKVQTVTDLADTLKILSDPNRLAIFDLLMQGVQCNCEIGDRLKLPMNLISHHLKVLRDAGLVDAERDPADARWVYYSINKLALAQLHEQLDTFLDPRRIQPRSPTCGPRIVSRRNGADSAANILSRVGTENTMKRRTLFLCTGNSARSQMAEALVNHLHGREWQAFSAGTHPTGYVHPGAIAAMKEIGVDISSTRSKSMDEFRDAAFDLIVTVCDDAAEECPVWLGQGRRVHLGFPDPAKVSGSEEEVLVAFRSIRDDIARKLPKLLNR